MVSAALIVFNFCRTQRYNKSGCAKLHCCYSFKTKFYEGENMSAFNVVRFRVKPGKETAFLDAHNATEWNMKGARKASIIKTGDRTFCIIGEWDSQAAIAEARPVMIKRLDTFRDLLEDLGGGLGVTDPISGETILELGNVR